MSTLKGKWMDFVKSQSERTARDPYAKAKLVGWVILLLLISYRIPRAEAGPLACGPCVTWAASACSSLIAAGGACASVALFPPALCACLLTFGAGACLAAAGTCAVVCIAPTV